MVARRALEREQRDRRHLVVADVARRVLERAGADEREPVAERQLLRLDHQAVDRSEHDRQRAAVVRHGLELRVGLCEARGVEGELGRLRPDGGQERLQRGVGLRAAVRTGRAAPAGLQVGRQVGQHGQPLRGGGVGGQAHEHADALADEVAGQRPVAVQGRRGPRVRAHLHQLERDLGAAGHLVGELPGGFLYEGGERVVQRAVVHALPVRRRKRRSCRTHGRRTECKRAGIG